MSGCGRQWAIWLYSSLPVVTFTGQGKSLHHLHVGTLSINELLDIDYWHRYAISLRVKLNNIISSQGLQ